MLKSLHIQNFLLIDSLDLNLTNGLVSITGETGAGKSIILGALKLVLGERLSKSQMVDATKKCILEAVFSVFDNEKINNILKENDIEIWDELILRREISTSGVSRNFINDSPVKLELIKEIQTYTIDIHSQFNNQLIHLEEFHRNTLDVIGNNTDSVAIYQSKFKELVSLKKEIAVLESKISQEEASKDYNNFLLEELEKLSIKNIEEQEELEIECTKLENAEGILAGLNLSKNMLEDDAHGILNQLNSLQLELERNYKVEDIKKLSGRVKSTKLELQDITQEIDTLSEEIEINPSLLEEKKDRLSEIYRLQKKHQVQTLEELSQIQEELTTKNNDSEASKQKLDLLQKDHNKTLADIEKSALDISKKRKLVTKIVEEKIVKSLVLLGMQDAKIEYHFEKLQEPNENGFDKITLLFSANKGSALQNLDNNISGGEISRLMFAIKKVIAEYMTLPCIIFDEIDTGISGKVASEMALLMKEMSATVQLIVITHLPQIASKGGIHFKVIKKDKQDAVSTQIVKLDEQDRIQEIAQMLSGTEISAEAIAQAKILLNLN